MPGADAGPPSNDHGPGSFRERGCPGEARAPAVAAALAEVDEQRRLVAERDAALVLLAEREARFRKAFHDAPIGMAVVRLDPDHPGQLLEVNRSLCRILGRSEADLLASSLLDLVHPDDRVAEHASLAGLAAGGPPCQAERRYLRPDGRVVQVSSSASPAGDAGPGHALVHVEDVTRRKEAEARLSELALHDHLTGLPNRLLLMDRLQHALARARRRRSRVAVLFCDLDRFKVVNDSLGPASGDQVLVEVARRLRATLRGNDTAARVGGDEFVVLCEDLDDEDEATAVAERVQQAVSAPYGLGRRAVVVTTSVGVVVSSGSSSPYALLQDADSAMRRAKERGRARCEVFDPALAVQARRRLSVEHGLRMALERGELRLDFQPIVELASGRTVGAEALVRWQHPERGLLGPAEFLAVAEETGLIVPMGSWVLAEACRAAAGWQDLARGPVSVAVNVAGVQVGHPDLTDAVAHALQATGLSPPRLCLELTESALIEASPQALSALRALKELGVRLAIDDFGTGYSSLTYLRRFPVDVVKVDRSFVEGLGVDTEDEAIVAAVVGLTRTLGLAAVAEGVETEAQLEHLRGLGCPFAQGYLFAPPLPPDELAARLAPPAPAPGTVGPRRLPSGAV